jgi:hypothetical protein
MAELQRYLSLTVVAATYRPKGNRAWTAKADACDGVRVTTPEAQGLRSSHHVRAALEFASADDGGLRAPLSRTTRSLMLAFPAAASGPDPILVGAVLTNCAGQEFEPGSSDVEVDAWFWVDVARLYATPGATFTLWYGRPVGRGIVLEARLPTEPG